MTIYFTADHHFGDSRARTFYRRPFASVDEMDEAMIRRWNAVVVGLEDEVWHLGDVAVRQPADRVASLLNALNGHKHLVVGNNDGEPVTACAGWRNVQAYAELLIDGIRLVLCHYPFRTWRDMDKTAINLHGHSHGRLKPLPRQCDVGVDVWDFRPAKLADILARAKSRI